MNIWLVTIGSSDIQLTNNECWSSWYYDGSLVKNKCHNLKFNPTQILDDSEEPYRIAPRVLGLVYEDQQDEVLEYLTFPLLDQFTTQLKSKKIDKIIILLTDQSNKFKEDLQEDIRCAYWQDTCELKRIIERYFEQSDKFPDSTLIPIILSPGEEEPGLNDWNHVLEIVQIKLNKVLDEFKIEPDTVYVSHQAGTPAISSAVQFVSLGKFAEKVQFLVSNEYEKKALEPIKSSKYLKAIKFGQAKELLKNHDYAAVKSLLNDLDDETQILLDAAIEWNYAKFGEFAKKLQKLSDEKFENMVKDVNERTKEENWWWTAYEGAYLAVIRLKQENTVEAMFHSFRAIEGLILEWAIWKYTAQIKKSNPNQPRTLYFHNENITMSTQLNYWFERYSNTNYSNVGLFGEALFELLKASHSPGKWHNNDSIKTVAKITKNERNVTFHQLKGLEKSDLFVAWNTGDKDHWEKVLLGCLNFIAQPDLPEPLFTSLEDASLMAQVHQKLEDAIASY
jgi:hypothetical protein